MKEKEQVNIYETATRNDRFSVFTKAVEAAGLADTLKSGGPLTIFAPTDDAFAKLPKNTLTLLLRPENKDRLTNVLKYHVVPGTLGTKVKSAKTLLGQSLKIDALGGNNIQVNNARVMSPSIGATNGIILPVDTVLIPHAAATAH